MKKLIYSIKNCNVEAIPIYSPWIDKFCGSPKLCKNSNKIYTSLDLLYFFDLLAILKIEKLIPDNTPPVVTSKEIIAQFIPFTAEEFGSP